MANIFQQKMDDLQAKFLRGCSDAKYVEKLLREGLQVNVPSKGLPLKNFQGYEALAYCNWTLLHVACRRANRASGSAT